MKGLTLFAKLCVTVLVLALPFFFGCTDRNIRSARYPAILLADALGQASAENVASAAFQFSDARQDSIVRHEFLIRNTFEQDMRIESVKHSCACATSDVGAGTMIPSGAEITVPMEVQLAGKSGPVESSTYITFTGIKRPLVLKMKGSVLNEYPASIEFGTVIGPDAHAQAIELSTFPGQQPLEIQDIQFDRKLLDVTVESLGTAREGKRVTVIIRRDAPRGRHRNTLVLRTNDSEVSEKRIDVTFAIPFEVEASPEQVSLGVLADGETTQKDIEVYSPYGKPIRLSRIEAAGDAPFSLEFLAQDQDDRFRLRVTARPDARRPGVAKGEFFAYVISGDKTEKVRIEAFCMVRDTAVPAGNSPVKN